MKKNYKIFLMTIVIIAIVILSILFIKNQIEKHQELKKQERYNEIRESVKKAVEWNIRAQHPSCPITYNYKGDKTPSSFYNSSFLINQGYIKKEELLDIDGSSYCDVYVKIQPYYEDKFDQQNNCEVYYKIYLKCRDYKDKGYINWG